ncbi:MAG: HAMP domain-containing sensor histidine kinase [Lachnospiraceae bacterium]|nr:HAMP domain-containing sensor histidine kinase [Lachnospiraceae bacterium]
MRRLFFLMRRSTILKALMMLWLACLSSAVFLIGAAVRIMVHFGFQYSEITGLKNFKEWISMQNVNVDKTYHFFMNLHQPLLEIIRSPEFILPIVIVVSFCLLLPFLYLLSSAGYHGKEEEACLRGAERIPYDVCIPAFLFLFWLQLRVCGDVCSPYYSVYRNLLNLFLALAALFLAGNYFLMITAAKLRTGTLFNGTLIAGAFRMLCFFIRNIPFVWKAVLLWGGILLLPYMAFTKSLILFWYYAPMALLFSLMLLFGVFLIGVWVIIQMNMIRKKAHALSLGGLELEEEEAEKKGRQPTMLPVFVRCLNDLNSVSDGMNAIVEEKMKSERFQTELITNVSHDIKTPLTSIINYLDFLSQEEKKPDRDPAVVQEYMEVLDRQSVRLRKLIEDLIEASKASTGSLKVEKEPCELGIFLEQIAGEYEERLERSQLLLHLSLPEHKIYVEVDGRHLWRVIDNLLQNACKYAMPGTRVYLQLQEKEGQAMIVIKNISAAELNIPAEELMERFVRGDRSRHTEGSGLGLSIAQSLTELQDGKFAIDIDGDLFKVAVGFPILPPPADDLEIDEILQISEK